VILYVVRHAEPDYRVDGLTDAGRREAEALAARIAALAPTHLYVSGLGRAAATAAYLERATGLVSARDDRLNELDWHVDDATWGRLSAWDVPGETVRTSPPGAVTRFAPGVDAVRAFSDALLARHGYRRDGGRYAIAARNDDRVVIVGHGGFALTWLPHLLDLPVDRFWCGFWLPPSSVTTVVLEERSASWATPRCTGLGDVAHLVAAGLPTSASGREGRGHA
jgi:probable phosphoglycerate mutase